MPQLQYEARLTSRPDGFLLVRKDGGRQYSHGLVLSGTDTQAEQRARILAENWRRYGNVNGRLDVGYDPDQHTYRATLGPQTLAEISESELAKAFPEQIKSSAGRADATIRRSIKAAFARALEPTINKDIASAPPAYLAALKQEALEGLGLYAAPAPAH